MNALFRYIWSPFRSRALAVVAFLFLCIISASAQNVDYTQWLNGILKNPEYAARVPVIRQMRASGISDQKIIDSLDRQAIAARKKTEVENLPAKWNLSAKQAATQTMCDVADLGVESGTFSTWYAEVNTQTQCLDTAYSWRHISLPWPMQPTRFRVYGAQPDDLCGDIAGAHIPLPSPYGGGYSIRLGDTAVQGKMERITNQFIVQPEDTNFIYQYAVVFQDPVDHLPSQKPYFDFYMLDQNNNIIPCSHQHYVSGPGLPGFYVSNKSNGYGCFGYATSDTMSTIYYKPWTIVGVNLADYIGQQVTVVCTNSDCGLCGHFGYTYLDFSCHPLFSASEFCPGDDSCLLVAPYASNYTYLWSTGETNDSIWVNPQLVDTVRVHIDQGSGCGFYSVFVPQPAVIDARIAHSDSCRQIHFRDSSFVSNGTITARQWDFGDGNNSTQINPVHNYAMPGIYNVILHVFTASGCDNIDTILLVITPPPTITASSDVTICENSYAMISATGGATYRWAPAASLNDAALQSPQAFPAVTTQYVVTGYNVNNCSSTDSVTVHVALHPEIHFNFDVTYLCEGMETRLRDSSLNAQTWTWSFSNGAKPQTGQQAAVLFPYNGNYTVTLVVENPPCIDSLSQQIAVGDPLSYVTLMPYNVFTPDHDGLNDCFHVKLENDSLVDLEGCFELEIFNRWGKKVFSSESSGSCWDGTMPDGSAANEGTYYFIFKYGTMVKRGSLSLILNK
jgi:gliding motility-associated-like protein